MAADRRSHGAELAGKLGRPRVLALVWAEESRARSHEGFDARPARAPTTRRGREGQDPRAAGGPVRPSDRFVHRPQPEDGREDSGRRAGKSSRRVAALSRKAPVSQTGAATHYPPSAPLGAPPAELSPAGEPPGRGSQLGHLVCARSCSFGAPTFAPPASPAKGVRGPLFFRPWWSLNPGVAGPPS